MNRPSKCSEEFSQHYGLKENLLGIFFLNQHLDNQVPRQNILICIFFILQMQMDFSLSTASTFSV